MDNNTNQQSKDTAALVWALATVLSIFSSAYFYFTKKEDAFVQAEAKRALNWALNLAIVQVGLFIATIILMKIAFVFGTLISLLSLVIFAGWVFICIKNYQAIKAGASTEKPALPIPFIEIIK